MTVACCEQVKMRSRHQQNEEKTWTCKKTLFDPLPYDPLKISCQLSTAWKVKFLNTYGTFLQTALGIITEELNLH